MASSPSEENEDGVLYESRHKHKLYLMEGVPRYTCSGCKAFGANIGFKCPSCPDFVLHQVCAVLPDDYVHPFFRQHPFKFRAKTHLRHHCDACGEVVRGSVFESRGAHLKLHPLCLALPAKLSCSGHTDHGLKLVIDADGNYSCIRCNKMVSKWRYLCETVTCQLKLDMNCAIVDFYGLSDHGISRFQRPSKVKYILDKLAIGGTWFAKTAINTASASASN